MEWQIAGALAAAVIVAAGGAAGGWFAQRWGEQGRRRAHAAYCREMVRVAGCARDRARRNAEELEERLRARIEQLEQALEERGVELQRTRDAIDDSAIAKLETRADELEKRLEERATAIRAVEGELERARGTLVESERSRGTLDTRVNELRTMVQDRDRLLANGKPTWLLTAPDGERDELQTIRGLGPVLEQRLHALGIFHFHQLARLESQEQVEWLACRINVTPSRIVREEWSRQAAQLRSRRRSSSAS